VLNGVLLPITLVFGWRLARNSTLLGQYRNGPVFDLVAGATVVVTAALSLGLLAVTLAGLVH
jgi:Mn2+/Fe2+ NRAMP family transporter